MGQGGISLGVWGERVAAWYLSAKKGYAILETNHHTRFGEIDIVAQDALGQFIFVEVKTRSAGNSVVPEYAVDRKKYLRIRKSAMAYISEKEIENARIDLVAVICGNKVENIIIRHHVAISDIWSKKPICL